MRIKILFVVLVVLIIIMSSSAIAVKLESSPGLLEEKNEKAPGHWKKNSEFENQKHFVNEIHNRIFLRLEQRGVFPSVLIKQVDELLPPVAIITWTNPVNINTPIFFYADSSYDPDGGDIVLIEWDVNGDGLFENVFNNVNPILLVYDNIGTNYIRLRVTDDEGQNNTVFETVIVI